MYQAMALFCSVQVRSLDVSRGCGAYIFAHQNGRGGGKI